jgi:sodium-dependent dicarboxylate transporter 2/3/5
MRPFETRSQMIGFFVGVALFLLLLFTPLDAGNPQIQRTAAVAALMAVWWMTNAIPIAATSLVPLVLFPMLGVTAGKIVAGYYINYNIFLFIGGFILALAMERWGLHRRIALSIVSVMGDRPQFLVLGFMIAAAFLSMWISNTATAMMMVPIGMSVIALVQSGADGKGGKAGGPFGYVLMLSIAYACSIGGISTPIGTPPNISFQRLFIQFFPGAPPIDFAQWFMLGAPLAIIFLLIAWAMLVFVMQRLPADSALGGRRVVREQLAKLGPASGAERTVLLAFGSAVFLWMFRKDIALPWFTVPGWSPILGMGGDVDDGTVAISVALLLFILPSGDDAKPTIMDWPTAQRLPWGIVLLFGGGFALAGVFKESGLSVWIGQFFQALQGAPNVVVMAGVSAVMTFLTELTSNTATTETAIPILSAVAEEIEVNPLLLLVPATLSASCAFMLPVATPPNAIVFGSGHVTMGQMIRNGIVLNLIGIVLIVSFLLFAAEPILQVDLGSLPAEWLVAP